MSGCAAVKVVSSDPGVKTTMEWWVCRVIVERKTVGKRTRWAHPVSGEEPTPQQYALIGERVKTETYYHVIGVGIVEPLEHREHEDDAKKLAADLQAKHDGDRFAIVLTIG